MVMWRPRVQVPLTAFFIAYKYLYKSSDIVVTTVTCGRSDCLTKYGRTRMEFTRIWSILQIPFLFLFERNQSEIIGKVRKG